MLPNQQIASLGFCLSVCCEVLASHKTRETLSFELAFQFRSPLS